MFNALYRPRVEKQDGSVDPTSVNIVLVGNYSYRSALRWQVFDAPVSVLPLRALYAIWYTMESEKQRAYESATSQVNRYRAAGMSKAGALNALNGAGGYTPAPVNASQSVAPQEVAPQIDLSGVANAAMGMMQLKEQRRQFDAQLAENKRQFDASFGEQQINNAKARELTDAQIAHLAKQNDVSDAQIKQITANTDLTWQEIRNKMAEYNLTVQQTAKLVEETKLTTEQILQVKAQNKLIHEQTELVKEQTLKTWKERGLTEAQTQVAWKQFEDLDNKVNQYLDDLAHGKFADEREIVRLQKEMLQFGRDIKFRENELDAFIHSRDMEVGNTPLGRLALTWEFFAKRIIPLEGLVSLGK